MLYNLLVLVCLNGECESFIIDYNLSYKDCIEYVESNPSRYVCEEMAKATKATFIIKEDRRNVSIRF